MSHLLEMKTVSLPQYTRGVFGKLFSCLMNEGVGIIVCLCRGCLGYLRIET